MNFEKLSGGEQASGGDDSPWGESYLKDLPPFNPDKKSEDAIAEDRQDKIDWDEWYRQVQAGETELRQSRLEAELREGINTEALLSEGDEELAHWARAIDNTTFAIPGQEDAADRRLEQAKRNYQLAKERRDAEQEVIEWVQDSDVSRYSQEELMARLDEFQYGGIQDSIDDAKERVRLSQACNRLRGRLEKFVPDAVGDLSDKDWEYWHKITSTAKKVPKEDLVPKTLPQDELAQLLGETVADDTSEADEGMSMEDLDTGRSSEQVEADKAKATVRIDEDFRRRMQEYNESRNIKSSPQEEKQPTSYHFEASIASDEATITVGQEIPDSWFETRTLANSMNESGFGINWGGDPKIDEYLQQALNVEFSKLSPDEREQYNYAALAKRIKEEARRTKRVPDIAAIINSNAQNLEQENEMGM